MLTQEQYSRCRQFIYRHGRLLERRRFAYHFEDGPLAGVLSALGSYQNPDGGFGHGLEMDLLCPASSPIAAEEALKILDEVHVRRGPLLERLVLWIEESQQPDGTLLHPPADVKQYPHSPWWAGADPERVLALAGYLAKWGLGSDRFFRRVGDLFESLPPPDRVQGFGHYAFYPRYLYVRFAPGVRDQRPRLSELLRLLPALIEGSPEHHPLLSLPPGYEDVVEPELLRREAERWVGDLEGDGGLRPSYPDLPWWRPYDTLRGLIRLQSYGMIEGMQ
ncbi:MAG TPA: hypothetical protein VGN26_16625 [Armatimonadota bacterium]